MMAALYLGYFSEPSRRFSGTLPAFGAEVHGGHEKQVFRVVYSHDGQLVASGSLDRKVCLWNGSTGRLLVTLSGHQSGVLALAFSPDDRTLASGSGKGEVCLWSVAARNLLHNWSGEQKSAVALAYSPNGKVVAAGFKDGGVRVWRVVTGEPIASFAAHDRGYVFGLQFASSGETLLTASSLDPMVRYWDTSTFQPAAGLDRTGSGIQGLEVSPDGRSVGVGYEDGLVRVYDALSRRLLWQAQVSPSGINALRFSKDSRLLATCTYNDSEERLVKLWATADGSLLHVLAARSAVNCLDFSPDGKSVAAGCADGRVWSWFVATGVKQAARKVHAREVSAVSYAPDGRTLATGSYDSQVHVVDAHSLRVVDVSRSTAISQVQSVPVAKKTPF